MSAPSPSVPSPPAASIPTGPRSCLSCGRSLRGKGSAEFPCPECGEPLARCQQCRDQSVSYRCPRCSFVGP
jgi:predicted RNA-binding Zn-ribbon protein involved in translation (DUF1610 family)